jgi:hypothetical protein
MKNANARTAEASMEGLWEVFEDSIISSGLWPACFPNLIPCDFNLWGTVKQKVYR